MTIQRLQAIVLRLGNQMFVRHYLWINYPNEPQMMGIELIGQAPNGGIGMTLCYGCRHLLQGGDGANGCARYGEPGCPETPRSLGEPPERLYADCFEAFGERVA
jgi:hypothetical protein